MNIKFFEFRKNNTSSLRFPVAAVFLFSVALAPNFHAQQKKGDTLTKEKSIDEVVLIGYGKVKKKDQTGSVATLKMNSDTRGFAPNAQDVLVGKIAGVTVTTEGGSPSGGATIRIRGGSSLSASNDPLIIIDGVMIDNGGLGGAGNILNILNPTDIDTFTVLKDASATAIYGSRASNGVILITTKKGGGKMRVTYDANMSVSAPKKTIDVLNADQYRSFVMKTFEGLGNYNEVVGKLGNSNTDWQKEIYRTTFNTENNLSFLGSINNKTPYRVSFGYTNLSGILNTSNMERYTSSITFNPTFFDKHLTVNLNGRGMYIKNRFATQDAVGSAIVMDPTQSVYDDNSPFGGYFTWTGSDNNIIQVSTKNPLSLLTMREDQSNVYNFVGNAQLDYKLHFLPDLHFNLNVGLDYSESEGKTYIPALAPSDYIYGGYDMTWDQLRRNSTLDFYTQYSKNFGFLDSKFDIMGGYSWQHYYRNGSNIAHRVSRYDAYGDPLLVSENNYATENYIVSFFGRLNYSIKDRYLFTFTLRNDGSSRFSSENRWSVFPSAAFAWKINEDFFKNSKTVSDLKLRLGWGKTGQQDINQGDYPYLGTYQHSIGSQATYLQGYNNGVPVWVSLLRPQAYNPDLKWETTETYNIGFDYGLWNNRIEGSIDLYQRKTTNLINAETKVAAGTNFAEYVAANIGSLENKGVEFSLNTKPIVGKNFTWEIGGNIAYNYNKITSLSYGENDSAMRRYSMNVHKVGYAAGMFYVYEQIYDNNGKPVEGFYKDQNNDGVINELDLRVYHKPTPDYTFGINTRFTYKKWDLSVASHGSIGNYNYNAVAANNAALSPSSIYANEFLVNRPTSAFDTNFQNSQTLSDYYVQNASFYRIDNIVLGYTFKELSKMLKSLRVYGTVQNPFVFTKYKGLDPEVFGGIDGNVYPRPLTVMLGTNFNF
jgi:iron complex outermembrane receptor protein